MQAFQEPAILDNQSFQSDKLLTIAQELGGRLLTRDADLRGHPLAHHAS